MENDIALMAMKEKSLFQCLIVYTSGENWFPCQLLGQIKPLCPASTVDWYLWKFGNHLSWWGWRRWWRWLPAILWPLKSYCLQRNGRRCPWLALIPTVFLLLVLARFKLISILIYWYSIKLLKYQPLTPEPKQSRTLHQEPRQLLLLPTHCSKTENKGRLYLTVSLRRFPIFL